MRKILFVSLLILCLLSSDICDADTRWNVTCNPGTFLHPGSKGCQCGDTPFEDSGKLIKRFLSIAYCVPLNSTNPDNNLQAVMRVTEWAGYVDVQNQTQFVDEYFTTAHCWIHHCLRKTSGLRLPLDPNKLDSLFCGVKNRRGLICSQCKSGYGVSINQPEFTCADCKGANIAANVIYWILAEFVPLFIIVVIFLLFDIQLSGPMNAFLLFANTFENTNVYGNSVLDLTDFSRNHNYASLSTWVRYFYSIWNLEFLASFPVFPPLCVSESFTDMDYLATKYISGFLPLFIILVIAGFRSLYRCQHRNDRQCCNRMFTCMQFCHEKVVRFQRSCFNKENVTLNAGFASFFLLAYSKLINVSFILLSTVTLSNMKEKVQCLQLDPYIRPFDHKHLPYAIPALTVIFFLIVLPIFILLCYMIRNRIEFYRRYKNTRLHQLDTNYVSNGSWWVKTVSDFCNYYAYCFKEKYYLFGMTLFLYRIFSGMIYALIMELEHQYVPQIALAGAYLILISWLRPYNSKVGIKKIEFSLNTVQSVFLLITILINAISLWNYHVIYTESRVLPSTIAWFVIQQILILLPFFYVIFFVIQSISKIKWCVFCKSEPSRETEHATLLGGSSTSIEQHSFKKDTEELEPCTSIEFPNSDERIRRDRDQLRFSASFEETLATQREEAKVERRDWCIPLLNACYCCHTKPPTTPPATAPDSSSINRHEW